MPHRRVLPVVAAVAAAALAAGCSSSSNAAPVSTATPVTTATSSPPTTSSAPAVSKAEQDLKDAGQTVIRFVGVVDELRTNPSSSINTIDTVAREEAADAWKQMVAAYRARQQRQTGSTVVNLGTITNNSTDKYTVAACLDVTKVDVINAQGQSIVAPDRAPKVQYVDSVARAVDGFFVTKHEAVGTC